MVLAATLVTDPVDCGSADRLFTEGRTIVTFGSTDVLVVLSGRHIFAVENRCPHMGRSLADARIAGGTLVCAGHKRRFDLASGRPAGQASCLVGRMRRFGVTVAFDRIWLSADPG